MIEAPCSVGRGKGAWVTMVILTESFNIRDKRSQCSESAGRILVRTTGYTVPYFMENLI